MTIIEAIGRADALKPNSYSQSEKIRWLSAADGLIKNNIIDTHEGAEDVIFNGYDDSTDLDTVLLAPAPYDELYLRWLEARIDYNNGEYPKYNNSAAAYNSAYSEFARYYNKTHTPAHNKKRFWF